MPSIASHAEFDLSVKIWTLRSTLLSRLVYVKLDLLLFTAGNKRSRPPVARHLHPTGMTTTGTPRWVSTYPRPPTPALPLRKATKGLQGTTVTLWVQVTYPRVWVPRILECIRGVMLLKVHTGTSNQCVPKVLKQPHTQAARLRTWKS